MTLTVPGYRKDMLIESCRKEVSLKADITDSITLAGIYELDFCGRESQFVKC